VKVVIDPNSGFCFGVVYAIQAAENELNKKNALYCLGDIVHNNMEVERLKEKGLKIISHNDLAQLKDAVVLIRAHGEPPSTYQTALKNNIRLIDASCPVVLRLQNKIRLGYDEAQKKNAQIVIYGKEGHAEVNGLVGQINKDAIIINALEDIDKIDFSKSIILFSQTTQSKDGFDQLVRVLKQKVKETDQNLFIESNDTICRQVANREPQISEFASSHDVIVFVSGKKSSNGLFLYGVCLKSNPRSYFISSVEEIDNGWFKDCSSVGVCGATSTPRWLMDEVAKAIKAQS